MFISLVGVMFEAVIWNTEVEDDLFPVSLISTTMQFKKKKEMAQNTVGGLIKFFN